ncbi:MAG: GH92 family glycosyl hydrolase [Inhella sp.]|uniref:GH92 family glycosyl hydrolase n=1 Tax=Inhella sp. TaxID=1921806 RepID=UPI0022C4C265|nr:GH92 family glycosyl hydrolase [Inhella sp.]MCZ8234506.1 GH92 family glycosyl hydrolase [Inhella sp.]
MRTTLAVLLLATLGGAHAQSLTRHVDPFIGTDGTGHVTPGATVPFGMVFPSPDNADRGWSFSGGYQYRAPRILGFSNTHMSGVGIGDLGDLLLQPAQGQRWTAQTTDFSSAYDKASERARPGHYAVTLKDLGVRVDLTATERVAFQRYTFAKPGRVQVLVDLQHGILFGDGPRVTQSQHAVDAARGEVTGTVHAKNWVERQTSFIVRFNRPIAAQAVVAPREGDKAPRLLLAFELGHGRQLEARVAVSTVDEAGARANLDAIGPLRFDAARQQADATWNRLLSRIQIDADAGTKRLFYSALYRTLLHPSNIADVDGRVRGPQGGVIRAPGGVYYSTLSLWDTFRASHPLYTLIVPERVPGFVSTLVAHQQQMGYLPLWTVMGRETHTMIGNPAMPVIADAIAKGFAVDREAALQAMLVTSTQDRPDAPAWAQRSWQWLDQYGYLPFDLAPGEAVSKTAEYGYGDAALAQVARLTGRSELAERFARRAGSWRNLFDEGTQTLRGKDSQGRWREPFDPVVATSPMNNPGDYTEANAYQYTATPALHDPEGFRERLGGPEGLGRWLDRFFTLPVPNPDKHLGQEALIGQYAHGNEPSHHIAWLYAFSDRPEQGHARVAEVVRRFYSTRPDGIVGNDDAGQMSAWLVFALLGFYPAQPASGHYVLGQPLVRGATLQLADGRRLRLSGRGPVARLNGQPVVPTALSHADLLQGGVLQWGM